MAGPSQIIPFRVFQVKPIRSGLRHYNAIISVAGRPATPLPRYLWIARLMVHYERAGEIWSRMIKAGGRIGFRLPVAFSLRRYDCKTTHAALSALFPMILVHVFCNVSFGSVPAFGDSSEGRHHHTLGPVDPVV